MSGHLFKLKRLARWRYLRWAFAIPAVPFLLWACNPHTLEAPVPQPEAQNDQYLEVSPIRDVDILFVIDNSPSMGEEQANIRQNFPAMINELKKIPGGLPNVHIAVVTSDLGAGTLNEANCRQGGDRGIFSRKAGCGLHANEGFIISENNDQNKNFDGDISAVFSCLAAVGDQGCGYEHQLQATRVALYQDITPDNAGFLRPKAYLAIIFITDEDDCSAPPDSSFFGPKPEFMGQAGSLRCALTGHVCGGKNPPGAAFTSPFLDCAAAERGELIPVADMVNSIRALKARPEQILVSGIYGWPDSPNSATYRIGPDPAPTAMGRLDYLPACQSSGLGSATAAFRIKAFVDAFGDNGGHTICQSDLRPAMEKIGEKIKVAIDNTCISAPLVDTVAGGDLQPDCQIIDRVDQGNGFQDFPLPRCGGGATPCWTLDRDAGCPSSGYKVTVDRGGKMPAPGTQQIFRCLTCTTPGDPRCPR